MGSPTTSRRSSAIRSPHNNEKGRLKAASPFPRRLKPPRDVARFERQFAVRVAVQFVVALPARTVPSIRLSRTLPVYS